MTEKQPIFVMADNVSRTIGRDAQRNNILAAKIVADVVKTTLGPKGMDKMIVDSTGGIIVTNDGVTILDEMELDHPAAKMIVDVAKTQESEVGDGTTTVTMLAGKLLENAEKLLDKKIHPTVIVKGYRLAAEKSKKYLEEISIPIDSEDILKKIAMTAMTGKGAEGQRDKLSDLVVSAIKQVGEGRKVDLENVKIEKIKGEEVSNSELVNGIVLNKEAVSENMPKKIDNAKIILMDFALELKSPEIETKISISTPEQLQDFITSEEVALKEMTDKIINSGRKLFFVKRELMMLPNIIWRRQEFLLVEELLNLIWKN